MEVNLKTEQIARIIKLIPRAFHATGISAKMVSRGPAVLMMYFADSEKELVLENLPNLPYIQFKSDGGNKSKTNFRPSYNCVEKSCNFSLISTGKAGALPVDLTLYYEGL